MVKRKAWERGAARPGSRRRARGGRKATLRERLLGKAPWKPEAQDAGPVPRNCAARVQGDRKPLRKAQARRGRSAQVSARPAGARRPGFPSPAATTPGGRAGPASDSPITSLPAVLHLTVPPDVQLRHLQRCKGRGDGARGACWERAGQGRSLRRGRGPSRKRSGGGECARSWAPGHPRERGVGLRLFPEVLSPGPEGRGSAAVWRCCVTETDMTLGTRAAPASGVCGSRVSERTLVLRSPRRPAPALPRYSVQSECRV